MKSILIPLIVAHFDITLERHSTAFVDSRAMIRARFLERFKVMSMKSILIAPFVVDLDISLSSFEPR